jgi:basic amino acid/polyamine antiporter, APA family
VLCILGTKVAVRFMTGCVVVATIGLLVSLIIVVFTSHSSFVNTVNSTFGHGTYAKTVSAGVKQGLSPSVGGYSTKSTIGCCYYALIVLVYAFWGTYLSAEFKGAGHRRRQLISMNGTGIFCAITMVAMIYLFMRTIGYSFFVSSLNGNFTGSGSSAIGSAGYVYFSALVASSHFLVVIIGLSFIGWFLPAVFINLSMPQRAFMTWSFDGLLPTRLSRVSPKYHTPVPAIVLVFILALPVAALLAYSSNFIAVLGVDVLFSYFSVVLVGVSAVLVRSKRPDLYRGSPAEWKIGGVEVLPIAGVGCAATGIFGVALAFYFSTDLGIKYYHAMEFSSIGMFVLAAVWWVVAVRVRKNQGLELSKAYQEIPPD